LAIPIYYLKSNGAAFLAKQSPKDLNAHLIGFSAWAEIASGKNRPRNDMLFWVFKVVRHYFKKTLWFCA
jgi:hypothetical protein